MEVVYYILRVRPVDQVPTLVSSLRQQNKKRVQAFTGISLHEARDCVCRVRGYHEA